MSKLPTQPNTPNLPFIDQLQKPIPSKVPLIPEECSGGKTVQNDPIRKGQHESFRDESFQMLMEIQDRQNTVLQQLIEQQQQDVMALTLPQPTMPTFNGDPTT